MAIASLALYYCEIPVDPLPDMSQPPQDIAIDAVGDFVYVVYYYNYECSKPLTSPGEGWIPDVPLETAERTWQWSVAYIVVSGIWVIASLLLLGKFFRIITIDNKININF
ncbi:hypothetical protein B566_EDAN009450 [Ephemera danica]|nr:hypothetical protein B566_EDAN009450 [Ephemera danica]